MGTSALPLSALRDWVGEFNDEALFCNGVERRDGFDEAIIGVAGRCSKPWLVVYDAEKYIEILMRDSEMDYDTAAEYFEFNVVGAWCGEHTPLFLWRQPEEQR